MPRYQVTVKRIVSSDGQIIGEAKSVVSTSPNSDSEVVQTTAVKVSAGSSSSSSATSAKVRLER
jgi:hypothetical protein